MTTTPDPSTSTTSPTMEELVAARRRQRHPSAPTPEDLRTQIAPPFMEQLAALKARVDDATEDIEEAISSGDEAALSLVLPDLREEVLQIFRESDLWQQGVRANASQTRRERRSGEPAQPHPAVTALQSIFKRRPPRPGSRDDKYTPPTST